MVVSPLKTASQVNKTHMKKLIWRLSRLPEPMELQGLVKDGIMTDKEAREILFTEKEENEPKTDELKSEIEFLRKLVEKLSNNQTSKVTEYIYSYPRQNYDWYKPYAVWCSAGTTGITNAIGYASAGMTGLSNQLYGTGSTTLPAAGTNFSEIKTF